ncbi:MAG: bifunctional diaminohydroxyphosphoribosylaminopyrimidine deaminase/5-amino-6-(5-phosphoribosylamino)uracil reductase RibD, partial [Thermodesulfobacteriota bacterium]
MPNEKFMRAALSLAKKGLGRTSPNPAVGAVVVKGKKIVARGYHRKAGLAHAEVEALDRAGRKSSGADLYVTLEPCCHHGRTPPCTDAIIEARIKRVFVGMKDPNPGVRGRGIKKLMAAGITVVTGMLESDCRTLNEPYTKHVTTGIPYVILKLAMSLDGRIATGGGESKWITGPEARNYVHKLRNTVDCVMVGSGTAVRDDPRLTVRFSNGRNPARAVVDTKLVTPPGARIFSSPSNN